MNDLDLCLEVVHSPLNITEIWKSNGHVTYDVT